MGVPPVIHFNGIFSWNQPSSYLGTTMAMETYGNLHIVKYDQMVLAGPSISLWGIDRLTLPNMWYGVFTSEQTSLKPQQ